MRYYPERENEHTTWDVWAEHAIWDAYEKYEPAYSTSVVLEQLVPVFVAGAYALVQIARALGKGEGDG